jgi:hypothetical protein
LLRDRGALPTGGAVRPARPGGSLGPVALPVPLSTDRAKIDVGSSKDAAPIAAATTAPATSRALSGGRKPRGNKGTGELLTGHRGGICGAPRLGGERYFTIVNVSCAGLERW